MLYLSVMSKLSKFKIYFEHDLTYKAIKLDIKRRTIKNVLTKKTT